MKSDILKFYHQEKPTNERNSMGCCESWYYSTYAISQTFTEEEVQAMSDREIELLEKLGDSMADAFY